jgi:hypothetical protein
MFDETDRVLLCSDLLHQIGDLEPVTSGDITGRYRSAVQTYQQSPVLMDYVPYTDNTKRQLATLAALEPRTLAAMHGSTFVGDGASVLLACDDILRETLVPAAGLATRCRWPPHAIACVQNASGSGCHRRRGGARGVRGCRGRPRSGGGGRRE